MLSHPKLRVEDVAHNPLAIDHVRNSPIDEPQRLGDTKLLAELAAFVGKQTKRNPVLGGEMPVAIDTVRAHAHHARAGLQELLVLISKRARLDGASGRVVLRVEVED